MDATTQREVARLLGATPEEAEAAVATLERHGVLEHGVLFLAVLASARWGTDAAGALRRFAEGQEPPSSWSDYEERTTREEAQEEAEGVLALLAREDLPEETAAAVRAAVSGAR